MCCHSVDLIAHSSVVVESSIGLESLFFVARTRTKRTGLHHLIGLGVIF